MIRLAKNEVEILHWCEGGVNSRNFGDRINPLIFRFLTNREVVNSTGVVNIFSKNEYYLIGSVLDGINSANAIVCGAGFQKADAQIGVAPKSVLAVRGPLSREIFQRNNVDAPDFYFDPAIVLPKIFDVPSDKKWRYGLIPHYVDHQRCKDLVEGFGSSRDIKFIDILGDVEEVVSQIAASELIISSSLHGVIVAHAYGVPAVWVEFSDKVIGGSFKFNDYYQAYGERVEGIKLGKKVDWNKIAENSVLIDNSTRVDEYIEMMGRFCSR